MPALHPKISGIVWVDLMSNDWLINGYLRIPSTNHNYEPKSVFTSCPSYRVFTHSDVTAAILVSQNNKTESMLVSQTSSVGVELFLI